MDSSLFLVFEDNHLFVLNKIAGLLTQPSGMKQDSLEQQAKAWLKERDQKPGHVFLEAVHRLDKPVSGLVVFGKTSKALSRLNHAIRAKQTKKLYYAWVDRPPPSAQGVLENYLIHDEFHAQVVPSSHPAGKLARLSYRLVESRGEGALIEINLETGRYHQIRIQMATIGCPIRGDYRYGSLYSFEPHAIALHHGRLHIPHPITQELCMFEAPLPASFAFP